MTVDEFNSLENGSRVKCLRSGKIAICVRFPDALCMVWDRTGMSYCDSVPSQEWLDGIAIDLPVGEGFGIRTYPHKAWVDFVNPSVDSVFTMDLAVGMRHKVRFCGQLPWMWSVMGHTAFVVAVMVELGLDPIYGWLHDAHEGWLVDMPSTAKPLIPGYKQLEDRLSRVIHQAADVPWEKSKLLKQIDMACMFAERDTLVQYQGATWFGEDGIPKDVMSVAERLAKRYVNPDADKRAFLRFLEVFPNERLC